MWIDMDQSQYCENSKVIIVLKYVSLSLAMEWILARSYFNIADLPSSFGCRLGLSLSIVCRISVVFMTFTKNKKNVNYFVWWILTFWKNKYITEFIKVD